MKLITLLFFSLLSFFSFGQKINTIEKPKVDKRIEILSIVFRLAESEEYSSNRFKLYTDKIEAHYAPYKTNELIYFIKKIRNENGVGYDAVMNMAIHIDDDLNPLIEFTDKIPDERWGKDHANEFIRLLKRFYIESNSDHFFKENEQLYALASTRFLPVYEHLDLNWYTNFYGKEPNEQFVIVNGLGNGGGNYGPSIAIPNHKKEVYAIMGTWKTDSLGMANYTIESYFPTLLHEFNHSFVNYLLDQNPKPFQKNGAVLYQAVQREMENQAYGNWKTMLNEALVRAAVIKYMKDHKFEQSAINNEINEQLNRGFLWIEDLVLELENYDKQRNKYPTLEKYMPNLIKAYALYASNIALYIENFDKKRPHVVSIDEFTNGAQNVNQTLKKITIHFDKPLLGKGQSISYSEDAGAFPNFKKLFYADDKKSITIDWELEPNKKYAFILTGLSFKSPEGISIKDYQIKFKTE